MDETIAASQNASTVAAFLFKQHSTSLTFLPPGGPGFRSLFKMAFDFPFMPHIFLSQLSEKYLVSIANVSSVAICLSSSSIVQSQTKGSRMTWNPQESIQRLRIARCCIRPRRLTFRIRLRSIAVERSIHGRGGWTV